MTDLKKLCMTLYGVYALSIGLLQIPHALVFLLSLLALVIAIILSYDRKKAAEGTPFASHLQWQIRTFWIGTGVIMPGAYVIALIIIWDQTDIASVIYSFNGGDPNAMVNSIYAYMNENMEKANLITLGAMFPAIVWWIRRCWVGYTLAKEGKPVEKVKSWL